jgi:hypothetical protein
MCLSWLAAIRMPDAVMKPEITGWLKRLARKPRRATPSARRKSPESPASAIAAARSSGLPGVAILPTAAAVMSETTATGPTASARLEPNSA